VSAPSAAGAEVVYTTLAMLVEITGVAFGPRLWRAL